MLTCKQVSNALSKEEYDKMPPMRRFFLRLHVRLCFVCGKFNRQVMDSQEMCRYYRENEEALVEIRPKLEDERKDELKELLASQSVSKPRE
jgi:hypothetical protein